MKFKYPIRIPVANGVGILPSIYGGKRITEFLQGKEMSPSIFDPCGQKRDLSSKNQES